jgi:hypothetical protein
MSVLAMLLTAGAPFFIAEFGAIGQRAEWSRKERRGTPDGSLSGQETGANDSCDSRNHRGAHSWLR